MFSIIGDIIGSVLLALLVSAGLVLLLLALVHVLYPRYLGDALLGTFCWVLPLFVFLCVQSFLFFGAVSVNRYVSAAENGIALLTDSYDVAGMDEGRFANLKSSVAEEYPLLGDYVDDMQLEGLQDEAGGWTAYIRSLVRGYIWRRVAWATGALVLVGGILLCRANAEQKRLDYLRQRNIIGM